MESGEGPTEGSFVGSGGVEVCFRTWPVADPSGVVVVAPGLAEHSGRYDHVGRRLATGGYTTWVLDHQGHGRSGGRRVFVDAFSTWVADLETFRLLAAASVADRPTFLLGHSMGGTIATAHVLDRPERFDGLVLSGPAWQPGSDVGRLLRVIGRFLSKVWPTLGVRTLDATQISRDPAVVDAYRNDPLVHTGKVTARLGAEVLKRSASFPTELPTLTVPLLLMHGTDDLLVPIEGARALFPLVGSTDKTLREWPGLHHEVFNEPERDAVLNEMVAWLDARTAAREPSARTS